MKLKLIIGSLLLLLATTSCRFAEKQDIILPDDHWGWFAIVYDCDCGEDKVVENSRIQQRIPDNGILLVNYPRPKGILDVNFYRESSDQVIYSVETGENQNPDSLVFSTYLARPLYNKESICDTLVDKKYAHTIVFYAFHKEKNDDEQEERSFSQTLMDSLVIGEDHW